MAKSSLSQTAVTTGAEAFAASRFAAVAGKRVGLVTNHTGRVRGEHLADVLSKAPNMKLTAIFAPEHGFRGTAEAGAKVRDGVDAKTGVAVFSLYGASRKPTSRMLRNVDVLVFDIQDIGVRFYTYISTMGLAMQAAAAARIPFVVLDRPNPLGGDYVSGFVLEPALRSFVGQYPIPIVHGMTVGELARMIQGEKWLDGLDGLQLSVVAMQGWQRSVRWPQTGLAWVATSPNIPTFEFCARLPRYRHGRRDRCQRGTRYADPLLRVRGTLGRWTPHGRAIERAWPSRCEVRDDRLYAAVDLRGGYPAALRGHENQRRARCRHRCRKR